MSEKLHISIKIVIQLLYICVFQNNKRGTSDYEIKPGVVENSCSTGSVIDPFK